MKYLSVFSGVEAASLAFIPLGWEPLAFCEIDPFPSAILAHAFPDVVNLGDICQVDWSLFVKEYGRPDVVVGGSPCTSFSVSGRRESLDGESRLMFEYIRAVEETKPKYFIWENVPGVLNTKDNAFGQFLEAMADVGYHDLAYRVLDAQFFGVAQRRRRVFVVGHLAEFGFRSAEILSIFSRSAGDSQTSAKKRKELTSDAQQGPTRSDKPRVYAVRTGQTSSNGWGVQEELTHTIGAADKDAVVYDEECLTPWDVQSRRVFTEEAKWPSLYAGEGGGHGYVIRDDEEKVNCFKWFAGAKARSMPAYEDGTTPTLTNSDSHQPAVAFAQNQRDEVRLIGGDGDIAGTVQSQVWGNHKNETLICQPQVMASGQANAEISGPGGAVPTIAARNYKDPPILFGQSPAMVEMSSQVSVRQTGTSSSSTTSPSTGGVSSSKGDGDAV